MSESETHSEDPREDLARIDEPAEDENSDLALSGLFISIDILAGERGPDGAPTLHLAITHSHSLTPLHVAGILEQAAVSLRANIQQEITVDGHTVPIITAPPALPAE
jgi:hypothetical protein